MKRITSVNPLRGNAGNWKRISIAVAIVALAGCASTEVMEYRSAPDAEVLIGKGGAVKVVEGIDVWSDGGTPPRAFKIIAESKTDYRTGTAGDLGHRARAVSQLAGEAKKRGADAVIVYGEASEIAGIVSMPGTSTTRTSGNVGSMGNFNAKSNTVTGPGYAGTTKSHTIGALFVKYL